MDERIRQAERAGDWERAGRLRCKAEGHLSPQFKSIMFRMSHSTLCDEWHICLENNGHAVFSYAWSRMHRMRSSIIDHLGDEIKWYVEQHLAKCCRCWEPVDLVEEYSLLLVYGMRVINERARQNSQSYDATFRYQLYDSVKTQARQLARDKEVQS